MKAIDAIQCDCSSNPDIDGYYDKAELEEQCEYLGQPKEDWMSHLFVAISSLTTATGVKSLRQPS